MSRRAQAFTYYGLALTLALAVALFGPAGSDAIQLLTMMTPATAVVVMTLFFRDASGRRSNWRDLGLGRAGFRSWPPALVVPVLVVVISYGTTALVHPYSWEPGSRLAVNLLIPIAIVSILAAFEEVGWRGYMLPRLAKGTGTKAAALVGLLHGIWHLPLILLTTAYHPIGSRWIVIPLFLALLTSAGIIYGWLRQVSGSVWPVALAHGTFNVMLGTAADYTGRDGEHDVVLAYLAGETGVFTLFAAAGVALVLARVSRVRPPGPSSRGGSTRIAAVLAGATVLVTLGAGGGVAASQIGSRQIADDSIRSRDVHDGTLRLRDLDPRVRSALRGAPGVPGAPGVDGTDGADGTDLVGQVVALVGPVAGISGNSGSYAFAGPPAQVTTTTAAPRVTGSASAPMGLSAGTPQLADVGMCFQPASGGVLTNFYGSNFSQHYFTTTRDTYATAATKVLAPGTYNVGMCVRNNGSNTISNNNYVNGWVQVTG